MHLIILLVSLVVANSYRLASLSCTRINSISSRRLQANNNNLDDLMIDYDKLSPKEKERLDYIQKISKEADELARQAGFQVDDDDEENDDEENDDADIQVISSRLFTYISQFMPQSCLQFYAYIINLPSPILKQRLFPLQFNF